MGRETVEIVQRGWYDSENGKRVDIAEAAAAAIRGTELVRSDDPLPQALVSQPVAGTVEVTAETTLSAARRLTASGARVIALNFASAKNPGGGFLSGSEAQEESLARSSALYACLEPQHGFYDFNRELRSPLYSDHILFSPDVPVFRDDAGRLLDEPYLASFITAPAVNAGAVLDNQPEKTSQIRPALARRLQRVLAIAASKPCDALVLGAWGCGVFRNKPADIVEVFHRALGPKGAFHQRFPLVVYAVYDQSPTQATREVFRRLALP
ncbi:MAG: hypothetical protein JWO56_1165 [Acidobacteria bacterium]|nr:hypothetical protein [Acidobacteriota bacterium]